MTGSGNQQVSDVLAPVVPAGHRGNALSRAATVPVTRGGGAGDTSHHHKQNVGSWDSENAQHLGLQPFSDQRPTL